MPFRPTAVFQRDTNYNGVRRMTIYAPRLLYPLMFFMLGQTTWTHIRGDSPKNYSLTCSY